MQAQTFDQLYLKIDSLYHKEDHKGCLALEQLILPLIGSRQDTLVANTYFYLGDSYLTDFKTDRALSYFTQERDLRFSLLPLDPDGYSNSLYNLMYTYQQDGNVRAAIQTGEVLLVFDEKRYGIESQEYVYSLGDYTDLLLQSDRWGLAEANLKKCLEKLSKGSRFYGLVTAKLGDVYSFSGLYSKASACFSEAMPVIQKHFGVTSVEYQLSLANYASLLMQQGKYDQAEEILSGVITSVEQSDWEEKEGLYFSALNNLSLSYQALGQYSEAETGLRSIAIRDSVTLGTNHPDFALTLSNLGQLYTNETKFENAERVLRQSLEILRINGDSATSSYAIKLNNLARNYSAWNQSSKAIPLLQQALSIFEIEFGKKAPEYATALFNLGSAYLSINPSLGYAYLKRSESIRRKLFGKRHPLHAEILEKLSLYQWQNRNKKEVRHYLRLVFENYYQQVEDFFPVLTEEEKTNLYFNRIRPTQEYYASWVCQEQLEVPAALGELYNVTLNTKGLILYATEKVHQRILQSGDKSLIGLFDDWKSQKELLAFYISQNMNSKQIDSLVKSSKVLEKELSRRSSMFSREILRPNNTWQEVQQMLQPGEAAMEIIRFKNYDIDSLRFTHKISYAFLILTPETKTGPKIIVYDRGDLLENRHLSYYRNGIRFKVDDTYSFENFWQGVHKELKSLKINTLYLAADGAYNLIALESIKNPDTKKYIIEELNIKQVTSTRELLIPKANKAVGQSSLLLGYPAYQTPVPQRTYFDEKLQNDKLVSRSIRGSLSRFARGENGIVLLPGTKVEIEKINQALSINHKPTVLLGKDANETNIKAVNSPSILHLATHGYFFENEGTSAIHTPNALLNSGLILAGASNFIRDGINPLHENEDGILTAYEAMNLNLDDTDLVVLSACETGLGEVQNGEGVYGLQRAFQLAGASYVIMSLWPVDDEATQSLMTHFYEKWLINGDVREAFRQAKLEAITRYTNAYYWGAFVLIGK